MFRARKAQRQLLNRRGIEFLSRTKKSLGAKLSLVCSHPKDCWSASLSLLCCGKTNNTGATVRTNPPLESLLICAGGPCAFVRIPPTIPFLRGPLFLKALTTFRHGFLFERVAE